jgi:glutamate-1-semialdehyde 2,1-aminomutase
MQGSNDFKSSIESFRTAQELFPGGVNSPVRSWRSVGGEPFVVQRGEGAYLFDLDGKRYIDYICSWGPLVLGHAPLAVRRAVEAQLALGWSFGAPAEPEVQLALEIKRYLPALEMMRFVSSGTEATAHVVRVARGFTGREKIVKFDGCYHGASDSLLATAGSGVASLGLPDSLGVLASVAASTITVPFNDLSLLRRVFELYPGEIALVMMEPVIGNSGFIAPQEGFLEGVRKITREHGTLLCFDEVMTGFRIALTGAQGYYGVTPDLITLGKVIGGGFPVGLYGGRRDIMEVVAPLGGVYQGGTLSGNPAGMAAGLATIKEWGRARVFEGVANATSNLVAGLIDRAKFYKLPFCASSIGTMFGFFFQPGPVLSYSDAKRSDLTLFKRFFHGMLSEGVYLAPSQFEAGFTSAAHGLAEVEFTLAAADRVFSDMAFRDIPPS